MRWRALLEGYAAHLVVLFLIITAITFARKDFDLKLSLALSAAYITALSIYFAALIMLIGSREAELSERRASASRSSAIKYWLLVLIYIGLIFYLSSLSNIPFITALAEMDPRKFSLHLLEYLGFGFLLYQALHHTGFGRWRALFAALLLSLAIAYLDESFQLSTPGRKFNPYDLYSDILGAFIGMSMASLWIRKAISSSRGRRR